MALTDDCIKYVAFLRSLYLLHQNNHWVCNGSNFYGNHLLFERLYQSAQENADLAAEKFVGLFGADCLDLNHQMKVVSDILKQCKGEHLVENSLKLEKEFLEFSQKFHLSLQNEGKMTDGLDDAICAIANKREEAVYLLKQTLGENNMNKVSKLADKFAQDLTPSQVQNKLENLKLQEAGANVIKRLAEDFGLSNLTADDLKFQELVETTDPNGTKGVKFHLVVGPRIVQQFQAAVSRNKQTHPNFFVGNYVVQLLKQFYPNVPATGTVTYG